ncbi:MAG TPA: hypothetical protein VEH49_02430 [Methylomirabilota bacterium]|nr:hypothetical protein [Methylomirabilota bacterium]
MRGITGHRRSLVVLLLFAILAPAAARADTIVLKNGRRIVARNVVEKDGKVIFETAAGEFSLPRSIVDHIERGASGVPETLGAPAIAAPPVMQGADANLMQAVTQGAVHDGAIDYGYISKLEGDARGGGPEAGERAALAHHAAAQFELNRGNLERALSEERTALIYAPQQAGFLTNVAYLYLRRSEFKQALDYLDRARRAAPNSADVAKLTGWAYYGMNKQKDAIAEWKRALEIRPDAEVQAALERAERELKEEESYSENESSHFSLKYSGAATPELAREVLRTLEKDFDEIEGELEFRPAESIGVVLYTQQAFADITRSPGWVGALNDGRIRVPVQGLTSVSPELARVLKHELTHSFVTQKTRGRCPVWLNEGLAQWMDGSRSGEDATALVNIYDAKEFTPLTDLEGSWMNLSGDAANYAYAWSLAAVEYLVHSAGMHDVTRILERIAGGSSTEGAFREVLRSNYPELTAEMAEYLRKQYVR